MWHRVGGDLTDIVQDAALDLNSMPSDNAQRPSTFQITTLAWHIHDRREWTALITKLWSFPATNTLHLRRRCDGDACSSASILASSPPQAALFNLLHVERGWRATHKPLRSSRLGPESTLMRTQFHSSRRVRCTASLSDTVDASTSLTVRTTHGSGWTRWVDACPRIRISHEVVVDGGTILACV